MKTHAYVAGVGMTPFGRHLDTSLKALAASAIDAALRDAGLQRSDVQAAWMGNAAAGVVTGQEMIRGECVLRGIGIGKIPVINVENACASSSTAFQQAALMVSAGYCDIALVCGYEKLFHQDKLRSLGAFSSALDIDGGEGALSVLRAFAESLGEPYDADGAGANRSVFMDIYALSARHHMKRYGTTREHFAQVVAKNAYNGSLNPRAQFNDLMTVEKVLAARAIIDPLTLPMCSPIGDGAAAVVLVSERKRRELGLQTAVRVAASALVTGWDNQAEGEGAGALASRQAYEAAGVGPQDLCCVELHDASAPAEIMAYEDLGLCAKGEGGPFVASGATALDGRIPVNASGGLLRKGHPVGATGCAQIVELTEQLLGRAGPRQVHGAHIAMAHNGGGLIGQDAAVTVVTILMRES